MDILTTFKVSASALKAHSIRLNTISSNLANVETTSTPEGGPYKKKSVYFETKPVSFQEQLSSSLKNTAQGVEVTKILEDQDPPGRSIILRTPMPARTDTSKCPISMSLRRWWT